MRVTKIEYQKKDPSRVNLYIDEKFFCGISLDSLASEALYEGLEIDDEILNRLLQRDLKSRFLTRVTEYLSHSPKTEFQVYRYLKDLKFKKKEKWFNEDIDIEWDIFFDEIVKKLKEYKYIDDESYARSFIQSRMRNKPRGKTVLMGELMSKGVSKDISEMVCSQEIVDEFELLKNTFEKKYRGKRFDIKDRKMVGFLQRKGFNWDLIERLNSDDTSK